MGQFDFGADGFLLEEKSWMAWSAATKMRKRAKSRAHLLIYAISSPRKQQHMETRLPERPALVVTEDVGVMRDSHGLSHQRRFAFKGDSGAYHGRLIALADGNSILLHEGCRRQVDFNVPVCGFDHDMGADRAAYGAAIVPGLDYIAFHRLLVGRVIRIAMWRR